MRFSTIPEEMRDLDQWVLWSNVTRSGKPTKIPLSVVTGGGASSTDSATWAPFENVVEKYDPEQHAGVGFVFSPDDPYTGIDLDGCRDPETKVITDWAWKIIKAFASYSEISPSGTGVKIWVRSSIQLAKGRKTELKVPPIVPKTPGIEVYSVGRYFAVTGEVMEGYETILDQSNYVERLVAKYWPFQPKASEPERDWRSNDAVVERARKYVSRMDPAVAGNRGHDKTFAVACALMKGFELDKPSAMNVIAEWNQNCDPPWSESELKHKIDDAGKASGQSGYLRNAKPERWDEIKKPEHATAAKKPTSKPPAKEQSILRASTLRQASLEYAATLNDPEKQLWDLGLADLDHAIGGGVDRGEMVVIAARPSHGKSLVALQVVHTMTASGIPCCFMSEEMSIGTLGKRAVQYAVNRDENTWRSDTSAVTKDLESHFQNRAECYIVESCRTADRLCEEVEKLVKEKGVQCVVVDYAQLLQSKGNGRYEQVTNTSIALRQLATTQNIILVVLAQMNRGIEQRSVYRPVMGDLKDSGQLEQDCDVLVYLVWPHRIDSSQPSNEYHMFVAKNRNREIRSGQVTCRLDAARQRVVAGAPSWIEPNL